MKGAGFEMKWVELDVTGSLSQGEEPAILVASTKQQVLVIPGDEEETRRNHHEVMRVAGDPDARLRLRGRAHTHDSGAIAMTITRFELVGDSSNR